MMTVFQIPASNVYNLNFFSLFLNDINTFCETGRIYLYNVFTPWSAGNVNYVQFSSCHFGLEMHQI